MRDWLDLFTSDHEIEAELRAAAPRPLPAAVSAELAAKRRLSRRVFFTLGLCCLVLARLPIVQALSDYFLPLRFLDWIGVALAVGWLLHLLPIRSVASFRHFIEGTPLPAVIRQLSLAPVASVNAQPTQYAYHAVVETRLSEETEPFAVECRSPPFSVDHRDQYRCSYRVGDTVTALALPGRRGPEIQLYGFLGMTPGVGVYRDREAAPPNPLNGPLGVVLLVLIFFALFWNLYAFGRFAPLAISTADAVVASGIGGLLGLAGVVASVVKHRRSARRQAERNREARERGEAVVEGATSVWGQRGFYGWLIKGALFLGGPLIAGVTAWCWAISANALLDDSTAVWRDIEIEEAVVSTEAFVFREYRLEFRFPGEDKTHTLQLTPESMAAMAQATAPQAAIRPGRFGWPWAADFRAQPPI